MNIKGKLFGVAVGSRLPGIFIEFTVDEKSRSEDDCPLLCEYLTRHFLPFEGKPASFFVASLNFLGSSDPVLSDHEPVFRLFSTLVTRILHSAEQVNPTAIRF
ncbi:MAG: hypothetical protein JOY97_10145 [Hyphomicrobiales bacterium]|nr:hypothetical protein [Hyphomicrobiales bacterium]